MPLLVFAAASRGTTRRSSPRPTSSRSPVRSASARSGAHSRGRPGNGFRVRRRARLGRCRRARGRRTFLAAEVPWQRRSRRGSRVAAGRRALGLPVLLVFGGLFAAADTVFAHLLSSSVPSLGSLPAHAAIAAGIAWLSAGLLRDLAARRDDERVLAGRQAPRPRSRASRRRNRDRRRPRCARPALPRLRAGAGALPLRRQCARRSTRASDLRAVRAPRLLRARGRLGARAAGAAGGERARALAGRAAALGAARRARARRCAVGAAAAAGLRARVRADRAADLRDRRGRLARRRLRVVVRDRAARRAAALRDRRRRLRVRRDRGAERDRAPTR